MAWFIVEIRYIPEKLADVRPRHRSFIEELAAQGTVAVAGPLADDSGGVVIYQAESAEALQSIIDADPYYTEGVIAERTVREFAPVLGSWLPR